MDISNIFGGDTLKAADLQGREFTLCIASAEMKKFDNSNKLVIRFQNAKKAFVCNKTNANRIAYMYGTNTDGWIGKEIVLYVDLVDFQGQTVEAIRVKPTVRSATSKSAPPAQRVVTTREGYELSTNIKHPNAPTDDGDGDLPRDEIPF
jgi:hypothetical protein